jgi:hypothetical protein
MVGYNTYALAHTGASARARTHGCYSLWLEFPSYSPIFIPLNLNKKPYRLRNTVYAPRLMALSDKLPHEFAEYN